MKKSKKNKLKKYKPVSLSPFETVAIQILNGSLTIKEGKGTEFALYNKENIPLIYSVEDDELQIIQNKSVPVKNIMVTLPGKHEIENLRIRIENGDLTLKGLNAKDVDIHLYSGSLNLKRSCLEDGHIWLDKGSVDTAHTSMNNITFLRHTVDTGVDTQAMPEASSKEGQTEEQNTEDPQ